MTAQRLVLVTGPSGAGRSSALRVLEDAGFEAVDNLPLRLLPALLDGGGDNRPIAVCIDPRNRDFTADRVIDALDLLIDEPELKVEVLYLDCSVDMLLRRFSETRRRHPMAPQDRLPDGISRELQMLQPLKARADILIDTSDLNVHQLRTELEHLFSSDGKRHLTISVQSFSYKRGLPRSADIVHDCRFLRNPYWVDAFRNLDGTDQKVIDYVRSDPNFASFAERVAELNLSLLPAYRDEGKSYLSIAFGCTGGQHRSVVIAHLHALRLAEAGWQVSTSHRELDRKT